MRVCLVVYPCTLTVPHPLSYTNTAHLSLSLHISSFHTHKRRLCVTTNTLPSIALSDWLSQRSENPHNGGTVVVIYDSNLEERTRCADV